MARSSTPASGLSTTSKRMKDSSTGNGGDSTSSAKGKNGHTQDLCPHHKITNKLKVMLWSAVTTAEDHDGEVHDHLVLRDGELFCVSCDTFVFHPETDAVRIHAKYEIKRRRTADQKSSASVVRRDQPAMLLPPGLGLCGLINLGNTCFMNSILQVLLHSPGIREFMLSGQHRVECSAACAASKMLLQSSSSSTNGSGESKSNGLVETNASRYGQCWKRSWSNEKEIALPVSDLKVSTDVPACFGCELECLAGSMCCPESGVGTPISAHRMLQNLWSFSPLLAGYYQQDAQEFYSTLINAVHSHTCNASALMANNIAVNGGEASSSSLAADLPAASSASPGGEPPSSFEDRTTTLSTSSSSGGDDASQMEPTSPSSANQRDGSLACACVVHRELGGVLRSQLVCQTCRNTSSRYEPFFDLPLDVSLSSSSLESCLDAFISSETVHGVSCSSCDQPRDMEKRLSVHVLPPTIAFHLKRFQSTATMTAPVASSSSSSSSSSAADAAPPTTTTASSNGAPRLEKNTTEIAFPANDLDVSRYVSAPCGCAAWAQAGGPFPSKDRCRCFRYRLRAVVQHKGRLAGGHYIAYIRYDQAEGLGKDSAAPWFRFDDALVHRVEEEEVLASEAYMLFYSRVAQEPSSPLDADDDDKRC